MMLTRKICVITGTRAEFGLLEPTMGLLRDDPEIDLQIVVTGAHLAPDFGSTYKEIESAGYEISYKVEMLLSGDTATSIIKSMGLGLIGFADAFRALEPDLIVLLGDRYEILAAAQAALISRVPIAHIHGGEVTSGAYDEAIRHSITKMSHIHFATTKDYKKRIIQLGENPKAVFNVGAPGLDNVFNCERLGVEELERSLSFSLGKFFLVTYHPETLSNEPNLPAIEAMLRAIDSFPDYNVLITYPNADTSGKEIIDILISYKNDNPQRVCLVPSLGIQRYLSAAALADIVIGNSSSGIIEVPSLKTATLNIGGRQQGRIAAKSVIHCDNNFEDIQEGIQKALSPEFADITRAVENPYGDGKTANRIYRQLKTMNLTNIIRKIFHDLPKG